MKKIFLFGYYGFGNLGDELLCTYYTNLLTTYFPETRVFILTNNPEPRTAEKVQLISRWNLWQLAKLMQPGDLLVGGGGSIIQDATSKRSLFYYLALLKLARRQGLDIILAGQGFGPLSPLGKKVASSVLNQVQAISCRDQWSLGMLVEMRVNRPKLSLGVDPLWDLSDCAGKRRWPRRPGRSSGIGFILRKGNLQLKRSLLANLKFRFGDVKLITLFPEDYEIAERLGEELANSPPVLIQELDQFLALLPKLSFVIGEKLHGLLLAARCGLPGIGLSGDPKIIAFCQQMGWSCFTWRDLGLEKLMLMAVEELRANLDAAVLQTVKQVRALEVKAKEEREWVLQQLGKALAEPQKSLVTLST
ncbi:MAG: hypothetical protein GX050_07030 [Firmicutes bacterium]|nr:hypothetical protein [Bacillota bacterium]